jgi:tripartite-type tricarboxylate transporter receptor subunit TctC
MRNEDRGMPTRRRLIISASAATAATALARLTPASADPIEDFYRGKTMRLLIGYGPGGGYDIYGRLVAQFLPRHLSGHPTIVVQNMPGAGSLLAAKYMYTAAPKDGTVLGSLAQTLALDSLTVASANIDVGKMPYIGRVAPNIDVGVALPKSGLKSFTDVRAKEYSVGASGGGSTTVLFPSALAAYAGAKFKLVRGYSGTSEILLAMERGEVDIVGAYGLPGMQATRPDWLAGKGAAVFLYQAALKRDPLIPDVPTIPELALSDEGHQVLRAAASTGEIGRAILTTPGVPAERLAALRAAFNAMLDDPDFLAECRKRQVIVAGATGEEMDALVRETLALPRPVIEKIGQMMR